MEYGELITRSFTIFWRHRYLWLLGALGGGEAVGGYSPAGSFSNAFGNRSATGGTGTASTQLQVWLTAALPLLIGLGVLFAVLLVVYFFVSCVSTGALVRAAAEHDAERPFDLRLAWQAGLQTFSSILVLRLLVLLVVVVVVGVFGGLVALGIVSAANQQPAATALTVLVIVVLALVAIPAALGFGIVVQLAIRAIVLEQLGTTDALARGFRLLFARLGRVLLVWLLSIGLGIGAGLAVGLGLVVLALPLVLLAAVVYAVGGLTALLTVGVVLVVLYTIASILVGGAAGSFLSTYWTLAFRRLEIDAPPAPTRAYPYPPAV